MTKWIIIRVQWLYNFIIIAVCPGIGYRKIAYLSSITGKAAGNMIRKEMHCIVSKVKEVLIVEHSQGIIECQVGRHHKNQPVQPFLAKGLSRQDGPAACPAKS